MFLNTRGNNREEVGAELAGFLEYAEKTDEETMLKTGSDAVRKIHEHISKIKASEEMGVRYMQAWEEKVQEREEMAAVRKAVLKGVLREEMKGLKLSYWTIWKRIRRESRYCRN